MKKTWRTILSKHLCVSIYTAIIATGCFTILVGWWTP